MQTSHWPAGWAELRAQPIPCKHRRFEAPLGRGSPQCALAAAVCSRYVLPCPKTATMPGSSGRSYYLTSFSDRNLRGAKGPWRVYVREPGPAARQAQPLTNFTLFSAQAPHKEKKRAAPRLQKCCSFVVPSHTMETRMRQSSLWEAGSFRGTGARTGWAVCDSSVMCLCNPDRDLANKHL